MKQYIGAKVVFAEPAKRYAFKDGSVLVKRENCEWTKEEAELLKQQHASKEGYAVLYPDGYESWSPKEVFEEAYRETDGMSFGLAIEAAKKGKKIARAGWNGKNQYVELAYGISYMNNQGEVVNVDHEAIGNKALAFVGTSGVQMGWLASQADMLADDWKIVE